MRVLVVDGNSSMQGTLCDYLETRGVGTATFSFDAADAVQAAHDGETDVIVLSTVVNWRFRRPKEADFEGLRKVPQFRRNGLMALAVIHEEHPKQRVIMLTDPASMGAHQFCQRHGAEAILEKPFPPRQLVKLIWATAGGRVGKSESKGRNPKKRRRQNVGQGQNRT